MSIVSSLPGRKARAKDPQHPKILGGRTSRKNKISFLQILKILSSKNPSETILSRSPHKQYPNLAATSYALRAKNNAAFTCCLLRLPFQSLIPATYQLSLLFARLRSAPSGAIEVFLASDFDGDLLQLLCQDLRGASYRDK